MCAYWLILKFDVFQARTGALVNLRDAFSPSDNEVRVGCLWGWLGWAV